MLLLEGDTITRISAPKDRSVAMLFGDGNTSSASIPLAIGHCLRESLACTGGPLVIPDLTLVDSNALVEAASSGQDQCANLIALNPSMAQFLTIFRCPASIPQKKTIA